MRRNFGSFKRTVECERCGQEVTFTVEWDYSVGSRLQVQDTAHDLPSGKECDLPESQVERELELQDGPEREYREDR